MKKHLFIVIMLCSLNGQTMLAKSSVNQSLSDNPVVEKENSNSISNSFLTLTFNQDRKSLELFSKPGGKIILATILPADIKGGFVKKEVNNSWFGKGSGLAFETEDGGSVLFALYPAQPFLFVTPTVNNKTGEILDIQKLIPVSFLIDLGKPAENLKTLGTGGLLDPDKNPGSYVFLTTVDPTTRNGVVSGWLSNEKGSGVVFSGIKDGLVEIKAQIDYGHFKLAPGKNEATETFVIGYFDDARLGEEQFADAIALNQNIKLKPRSAVYCTWYSEKNGGAGTEALTIELAGFIKNTLKPYGMSVLQIDDQWQDGGEYNGPRRAFDRVAPKGGYPNGMAVTAEALKKEGLTAGIWWMPFARNHQDPEYKDRKDWFAYRTSGKPFETTWGGTSLDLTHPEVKTHIAYMAKTMHNWGFDYFKMDGLWTGTVTEQVYINDGYKNDSIGNSKPLFDPSKTQIEAFRDGLKILRNAVGEDVFFSGCCVSQNMRSFGASFGLVNAMRIGPDFNHDGQSIRTGAIRASRLYFLNGRVWWNDPDPSMIREDGKSTADGAASGIGNLTRARLLPSFVAVSSQFFLSSDWLPQLPEERIEIMKRTMASHTGIARPVDAFNKNLPSIWLATDSKSGTERNVIGLFNWETNDSEISSSLSWAGLKENTTYYAFDFWKNKPLPDISGSLKSSLGPESCQVIALRAKENHPVIVSTSQHVTQGMIDVLEEKWENETLSATCRLIEGDSYEIRIAGLNDGGEWKVDSLTVVEDKGPVLIEMLPQTEKGWLRIMIKSNTSQVVKWQVKYKK